LTTVSKTPRAQRAVQIEPAPPVVFMFPGQGAQRVQMARELYLKEPQFSSVLEECAERVRALSGIDLTQVLYPSEPSTAEGSLLDKTSVCQPALFAVEYAMARLFMSWGIRPSMMIGHSLGEYVAACLSGVLSLEDALALVVERGRLMELAPKGK